jgi:hypothetical protein
MVPDVDIIVPVLWRPGSAAPFVASLRASVDMTRVALVAVASDHDRATAKAWAQAGADVLTIDEPGTFARKVNHAYRTIPELGPPAPWMLLLGDDVRFEPGWLDEGLAVAYATGAQVVCTNDMGFHKDARGGTHPFVARGYVDRLGASWDGPGVVCHEGYRHTYVDSEIMAVAKYRHPDGTFGAPDEGPNLWAPAPKSVIHHLHHIWRTAPVDATYQLGTDGLLVDRELFYQRLAAHRPPGR